MENFNTKINWTKVDTWIQEFVSYTHQMPLCILFSENVIQHIANMDGDHTKYFKQQRKKYIKEYKLYVISKIQHSGKNKKVMMYI
jgi:hypothetical protein